MSSITFVVPVGDYDVYSSCFLSSPLFRHGHEFQILAQHGFKTSGEAYNDAIDKAENDIIVFAHQDVIFPPNWSERFLSKLYEVETKIGNVGVIGCIGVTASGNKAGHIYRHDREFFPDHSLPGSVQALDELLVSFRRSSGLRFDPALPSFFFYGLDICLQSEDMGYENFAVDAPCFHQAKNRKGLPDEFYSSWLYIIHKWRRVLPVQTLFGPLDGKRSYWIRRFKELVFRIVGHPTGQWWEKLTKIDAKAILSGDISITNYKQEDG